MTAVHPNPAPPLDPAVSPSPEGVRPATSRLQAWLLGLLLLWAFAVRLVFSWPDPTMNRIWDERYNADNVAAILAEGRWRPVRVHYPTLSYLPQALVLKGWETARALPGLREAPSSFAVAKDGRPHLTSLGVRTSRAIQVLAGTASLWVLFLVGRRLFGSSAALLSVLLLSVVPWHLRQSVAFKPDIMLVLTATVALYAMLAASRSGTLRSYAVAGAMVGATAASKWNGGALLIPLLVAVALGGIEGRRVGLLARRTLAAGASAAGVLLLLNPWLALDPDLYRRHLGSTVNQYQERLVNADSGWFDQPLNLVTSLVGGIYFGPVLGAGALVGLAGLLVVGLRRRRASAPRSALDGAMTTTNAWIILTFFGGYVGALWAATRYPKPPNWLIVAPVAALAGAWVIVRLVGAARGTGPAWRRRVAPPILILVVGAALAAKVQFVHRTVYDENVPLTTDEAARVAGDRKPLRGRTFMTELELGDQAFDPRIWDSAFVPTVIRTPDIAAGFGAEAATADALLFAASRLGSDQDPVYRELKEAAGATGLHFGPELFRLRGEPVVLVRRRFDPIGPPSPAPFATTAEGIYEVDLTAAAASAGDAETSLVSLEVAIRTPSRDQVDVAVEAGGLRFPCRSTKKGRDRRRCLTPRFAQGATPVRAIVEPPREVIDATVFRWGLPD